MQVESFRLTRNRDSENPLLKVTLVVSTFSYPAGKTATGATPAAVARRQ
jgi:hypothetical protein